MANTRYRASINGFWCHNETWDDVFNWDGKHDEVFLSVNTKVLDATGTVLDNLNSESELMGDTWRLPGRTQAGSASDLGGIVSGDKFPWAQPMIRQNGLNTTVRVPPYLIWEGDLPPGRMVFLSPTIWEWDPGAGAWDGWLAWQKQTDEKYGQRAKEIFGKIWPVSKPVFDAVSLGIQTFGTLAGLWSPLGQSMRRPIGLQRDPANPDSSLFNPYTIALNAETAEYLVTSNPQGHGDGIRELLYVDDPYLRGVYAIFVQIEKLGAGGGGTIPAGRAPFEDWTQGPYYGSRGIFFADVTGDGRADAIVVNEDTVTVRRSTGSGFGPNEDWTQGPYYGSRGIFFADVTGDGRADAIVLNGGGITARRSTGAGFAPNEEWPQGPYNGARGTRFADVTGDAVADAIRVDDTAVMVSRSRR
jgi:hypothetical protein